MKRLTSTIAAALVLSSLALAGAGSASAEKYVAMGDSYSAGNGTGNYDWDGGACERSSQAYAPLIRGALGAASLSDFKFAACGGAVINHVTTSTQSGNPGPQVSLLGNDTLDATISIGGNDAGFSDVLLQCGYPFVSCDDDIDAAQAYITDVLPDRLDTAYGVIRQKAPNARIGVVGYPRLFPADGDDCSAATFFSAGEIARLNQTADMLADVTRARARTRGFAFVDSRPAFTGHAWCEDEWINGLSNPTSDSFHPNVAGYQGYAGIVRGAMLATPAPAFNRGDNGRIAFSSDRDGNNEIYVINGDGGFPVNLTQNGAADEAPAFSPDGTKIVFASDRDTSGNFEIYTMDSTGGNLNRLTNNAGRDYDPSFSPNGKQIVFSSDRAGNNEIYKINADGSNLWNGQPVHRLTNNTVSDFLPSFSPDGAEIAFQRFTSGSGNGQGNEVYKMSADGQGQINLTANAGSINDGGPQWSPDGSQIAFHSNRIASDNFEIYTVAATGGTATRRTTAAGQDRNPSWAPSGSHMTFQSDRAGTEQIYTMTATGSGQTRRTTGGATELAPSWQGDARTPETAIDSGPPPSSNNPVGAFSFSSDEAGSSFECRLDGAPAFQACSTPFLTAPLEDGGHSFEVRATDPSGNTDPDPATLSFAIDTSAQVSEITAGPNGPTNLSQPVFEFTSDDETVTFECRLDPGTDPDLGWEDCTSPHQLGPLTEGPHSFQVRGTDGLGNVEPTPPARLFTVDTIAPESAITFGPPASSPGRTPVFEFTSNEAGSSFECRLDGEMPGAWEACESPRAPGELPDGEYSFAVRASDQALNLEPDPAVSNFTIDTQAPVTTISSGPGAAHPDADVSFEFAADDLTARYECRLDSLDDSDWSACISPKLYPGLNHGRHAFQVRAVDGAGNAEAEPVGSEFGVKTSPGYVITEQPDAVSDDQTSEFLFESADPDAQFECRLDSSAEAAWEPCASPFAIPHTDLDPETQEPLPVQPHEGELAEGEHKFELRGTDWFGDVATVQPYEWTVVTGAPQASILSGPAGLANSGTAVFELDAGYGATSLVCQIDGSLWAACDPAAPAGTRLQTATFTGLNDGGHDFRVRASGPLFGTGPEAQAIWSIDQTPPEARIDRAPVRQSASAAATFEFSEGDSESGVSFRCRVDAADPAGPSGFAACSSPFSLSDLADGDHRFEVVAVDAAGNVSPAASRNWTVDTTGPVVELIEAPPARTTETGADFGFSADEPTVAFACSLDRRAWKSCVSPVRVSELAPGDHSFGIRASDSLGNTGGELIHRWTVSSPAPPPVRPSIKFKRRVKLKPRGATTVAKVVCPADSPCRLTAPRRATLRVGPKQFKVRVKAPRRIAPGRTTTVAVIVPKAGRRALGRRVGTLKLKLTVSADNGLSRVATGKVRLRS